jgi:hypothetical protein
MYERYGKFDDYAVVDTEPRLVQFTYDQDSSEVAITVPHFWNSVGKYHYKYIT